MSGWHLFLTRVGELLKRLVFAIGVQAIVMHLVHDAALIEATVELMPSRNVCIYGHPSKPARGSLGSCIVRNSLRNLREDGTSHINRLGGSVPVAANAAPGCPD